MASSWLELLLQQCFSISPNLGTFFCFPSSPKPLFPSGSISTEGASSSNGDHYSSERQGALLLTAGHVAHGRHLRSTCRSAAPRNTLLVSAFWSHQPSASCLSGSSAEKPIQAPPTRLVRSALSKPVAPCQPRAAQLPAQLQFVEPEFPRMSHISAFLRLIRGNTALKGR